MPTRRHFLSTTALAAGATLLGPLAAACTSPAEQEARQLGEIGFISGILKANLTERDWREVLTDAVELGFTEYEGGPQGDDAQAFSAFLQEIGLKHVGAGLNFTDDLDAVKQQLDERAALGVSHVTTYWPWLVGAPFGLSDCQTSAPILNQMGALAQERGLTFCWHNHDREFKPMENGQKPFDFLLQETDPEVVHLEMDVYWVAKGGADPVAMMQAYPGRTQLMHVKDMAEGEEQAITCPGDGILDFAAIFAEAQKQQVQHYFVERDRCPDGLACLASSGPFLQDLRF